MADIKNRAQPIRKSIISTQSTYSRVVSCAAYIKAPATQAYGVTRTLGQNLWVKNIQIFFAPHLWNAADWIQVKVFNGHGEPGSFTNIQNWTNVLPINWNDNTTGWWVRYETFGDMAWDLNQLYSGEAQRFGIAVEAGANVTPIWIIASFQISEG